MGTPRLRKNHFDFKMADYQCWVSCHFFLPRLCQAEVCVTDGRGGIVVEDCSPWKYWGSSHRALEGIYLSLITSQTSQSEVSPHQGHWQKLHRPGTPTKSYYSNIINPCTVSSHLRKLATSTPCNKVSLTIFKAIVNITLKNKPKWLSQPMTGTHNAKSLPNHGFPFKRNRLVSTIQFTNNERNNSAFKKFISTLLPTA